MATRSLRGLRVGVLAADGFEQVEVTRPLKALRKHGADVSVIAPHSGSIRGVNLMSPGKKVHVDGALADVGSDDFDALFIPGGLVGPDTLRRDERALALVRAFNRTGKPIAAICHGPQLLISADVVRGRCLTSWPAIATDVRNAGGLWEDQELVRDGNWLTSRGPQDLRAFDKAIVHFFREQAAPASQVRRRWPRRLALGAAIASTVLLRSDRARQILSR
jgi:protease I